MRKDTSDVLIKWIVFMIEIIPAVLLKNSEELEKTLETLSDVNPYIHLDVLEKDIWVEMENEFEVHLMVENPEVIIDRWVDRGAKRIIVHKLDEDILMHRGIVEIGLGVKLDEPLGEIFPLVQQVDFLNLMSISEIGEQGHPFDERIFARIKEIKQMFPEIVIVVDGGINLENSENLLEIGVDRLVVGSAIFGQEDPEEAYEQFLELIN